MSKRWQTIVLVGIAATLFLIPNLFWGNLYIVGGDDARLYYLYPLEYLKNFSFNVMSGNTLGGNLGYTPVSYSAPLIVVFLFLKTILPFVNTQLVSYGISFSLGFLFFYLFLQEWNTRKTPFYFWSSVVASLSYLLSLYLLRTFFQSQFISLFLRMAMPGSLYLFVSGLNRKSVSRVIASSLFYSLFGASVYGFPWLLPVLLTLIPLLIYFAVRHGKFFWKMALVFVGVFVLCNVYWIIHYIIPVLYNSGEANYTASLTASSFIQRNNDLIETITYLNSPVHQIAHYLRISWQDRGNITLVQTLGVIYLSVITGAGILLGRVKKDIRVLYLVASSGLLLSMLFETPNFGSWSVRLFQFLNTHIPFFVIFRNMYDKFALAMAFNYAFTLWISFMVIIESKILRPVVYILLVLTLGVTLFRSIPYVSITGGNGVSTRIGALNQDYMDLARYIKNMHTASRFVWYPMTFGDYVYIADRNLPNHYYVGISPLQIFAQASDLAGFYGLQTPGDPELNWKVLGMLQQGKFTEVGNMLKQQNVGYVIVNNEKAPLSVPFVLEQFDFMKSQTEQYKKTILGEKIRDFGSRYSLYAINPEFRSPAVFLSDAEIPFRKSSDGAYDIGPFTTSGKTNLTLMEPYSRLWTLAPPQGTDVMAYGYGNQWALTEPGTFHVKAEFWPNKLIVPSIVFSIVAAVIATVYCVVMWI